LTAVIAGWLGPACQFEAPIRSDFAREVPLPDATFADVVASPATAWRATSYLIDKPNGLKNFQATITTPAVNMEGLNFIIAEDGGDLASANWAVRLGTGDRIAPGRFRMSTKYPPAVNQAAVDGAPGSARAFATTELLTVVVAAYVPYEVPNPLVDVAVTATVAADDATLMEGRITGTITGESAAITLLDLQNDGDPKNDPPLLNFLGSPDLDLDGDGTKDDFAYEARFESSLTELLQ
jgi:hypothetical protein